MVRSPITSLLPNLLVALQPHFLWTSSIILHTFSLLVFDALFSCLLAITSVSYSLYNLNYFSGFSADSISSFWPLFWGVLALISQNPALSISLVWFHLISWLSTLCVSCLELQPLLWTPNSYHGALLASLMSNTLLKVSICISKSCPFFRSHLKSNYSSISTIILLHHHLPSFSTKVP